VSLLIGLVGGVNELTIVVPFDPQNPMKNTLKSMGGVSKSGALVQYVFMSTHCEVHLICLQWDDRLLTLDPISLSHVLKNSTIYEKPWQSRRLITKLIGCGMLAAEGDMHKRQRRVATSAFGVQNMKALVPLVWGKGNELKDRWLGVIKESECGDKGVRLDVCHWISRATFDVIGLAGMWSGFG